MRPGDWIPARALVLGQLAHGSSWLVMVYLAFSGRLDSRLLELGWVHLVALGWLTLTALAVLVHVIPAFTDGEWKGERTARRSLAVFALGVTLLVGAFLTERTSLLPWGAGLIAFGLFGYALPASMTLARARQGDRTAAAVARALAVTLSFLLLTAALGVAFTFALNAWLPVAILAKGAPIHAILGIVGWLSLLVVGVSAKTIGPITGGRSSEKWKHIAAATLSVAGLALTASGFSTGASALTKGGLIVLSAAAIIYTGDMFSILRRATIRHRPPQAFVAASIVWLVVATALGWGAIANATYASAWLYVMLIGWLGQMVNAHLLHIGIRLLITAVRGDDDETRPGEVLSNTLSWSAFVMYQFAIGTGAIALLIGSTALLLVGALFGFLAWTAMALNVMHARRRAGRLITTISLIA
jgi:hypothetical protein